MSILSTILLMYRYRYRRYFRIAHISCIGYNAVYYIIAIIVRSRCASRPTRHDQAGDSSGDARHGLRVAKPQKCRLAPTVKHTGQESGSELCETNFDRFCSQNLHNNVCKLYQLLGTP